jgi:3-hydroxyacyl-[acyl-carrier-protein] dehydratase
MNLEYFHLIDRITDLNVGERTITVEANVPEKSTIFEGHFPGYPLMPGVLLIEAMAQTSGWLLIALMDFQRMPFLVAVKEAKMRTFITPGTKLQIDAGIEHQGDGFAMTRVKIRVDGKLTCNATLTFKDVPFPHPDLRGHMETMARRIDFPLQATASKAPSNG